MLQNLFVIPAEAGIQIGQTPSGWHIYYIDGHKVIYHFAEVVLTVPDSRLRGNDNV